jgi:hypothetical protein
VPKRVDAFIHVDASIHVDAFAIAKERRRPLLKKEDGHC